MMTVAISPILFHRFKGRVNIQNIIERQFLPLKLARIGYTGLCHEIFPIKSRLLMRVLSVPQFLDLFNLIGIGLGKLKSLLTPFDLAQVVGDGPVIAGGMLKDLF